MDGTLAGIFLIASLTDMALNDCPTGCLAAEDAPARLGFQLGAVEFNGATVGEEIALRYDFDRRYGPFQPVAMASVTDKGRVWAGVGARWEAALGQSPFFVEASLIPGYDTGGDGPDIGGRLQFRSAFGVGYTFDNGATLTAGYDHRSNADTQAINPGLETISVRYAITFN